MVAILIYLPKRVNVRVRLQTTESRVVCHWKREREFVCQLEGWCKNYRLACKLLKGRSAMESSTGTSLNVCVRRVMVCL